MIQFRHSYEHIISLENLLQAWREFVRGKKNKKDVAEFSLHLSRNVFELHRDLKDRTYQHGQYEAFSISDPKPRSIHKASVRDRLLHHAVHRVLYPYFDSRFVYDSYSCRNFKGTHRAINRFRDFVRKVSKDNSRTCWVLKCDIRKFFASIDQKILVEVVKRHITDPDIIWLINRVVESFQSTQKGKGLPLGNLTSQLLVNIYMNEFDQFVKHKLKVKYYIRYADDFVIFSQDRSKLKEFVRYPPECTEDGSSVRAGIVQFLREKLKLELHPEKVFIKTVASGVDFLGWVHFPDHRVLRTTTKKRMFRKLMQDPSPARTASYLGMLSHGNTQRLQSRVANAIRE